MNSDQTLVSLPSIPRHVHGETQWDQCAREIRTTLVQVGTPLIAAARETTDSISALRLESNWAFSLLHDQMEDHRKQLVQIVEQMREMNHTLKHQNATAAREALEDAIRCWRQGLIPEAFRYFETAERIRDVDFLLQFYYGKALLTGSDKGDLEADLDEAERHLLLAHRYASAARVDLVPYQ